MWIAAALLLLQDDAAAQKILRAAQERLASARTLRAEIRLVSPAQGEGASRLNVLLKAGGRWRLDVAIEGTKPEEFPSQILSDGRTVRTLRGRPRDPAGPALSPADGEALVREALHTSCLLLLVQLSNPALGAPGGRVAFERLKDEGEEVHDGRTLRAISGHLKMGRIFGDDLPLRILVDPAAKTIVRREISMFGAKLVETIDLQGVDEDIPDEEFAFQTLRRLNQARAAQAAAAVDLFTRYTGRLPRAAGDLAARPAWLPPDVWFPAGGFVLGAWPADPWGRPYEIAEEKGQPLLGGRGADARAGGRGDAEDVRVPLRRPTGRAVGAPSERLARAFETRVRLQLLSAAVRGYAAAYGELPRRKAALWEKTAATEVWPAGGWIPAGMPADGWGEPLRMITETDHARLQCADPKARRLGPKALTPEERAGLEETARLNVSPDERAALERLMDGLRDEDFEKRERADEALRAQGPAAAGPIEARLSTEKDTEARARLGAIRTSIKIPPPSWPAELGYLSVTVRMDGDQDGAAELREAVASLKTLASAQADFRGNDRDGNNVNDFWAGDVAGLYGLKVNGQPIGLIDPAVAAADAAPLQAPPERAAKGGYLFRAMTLDETFVPYNKGQNRNPSKFGFCAIPEEYGVTGTLTAILNENNTVFVKDTGGEPVLQFPNDEALRSWTKQD